MKIPERFTFSAPNGVIYAGQFVSEPRELGFVLTTDFGDELRQVTHMKRKVALYVDVVSNLIHHSGREKTMETNRRRWKERKFLVRYHAQFITVEERPKELGRRNLVRWRARPDILLSRFFTGRTRMIDYFGGLLNCEHGGC